MHVLAHAGKPPLKSVRSNSLPAQKMTSAIQFLAQLPAMS